MARAEERELAAVTASWEPLSAKPATSTDVVISMAWGYSLSVYSGYAVSLRRTGYGGDIKILGLAGAAWPDGLDAVEAWSARFSVDFVPIPKPALPTLERFGLFATVCRDGGYRRCIVGDMRDVFFQTNPFSRLSQVYGHHSLPDLVFPLEVMPVGTCFSNGFPTCMGRRLMGECFGSSVWQRHVNLSVGGTLADQPTICALAPSRDAGPAHAASPVAAPALAWHATAHARLRELHAHEQGGAVGLLTAVAAADLLTRALL